MSSQDKVVHIDEYLAKQDSEEDIQPCPESLKLMVYLEDRHKALEQLTLEERRAREDKAERILEELPKMTAEQKLDMYEAFLKGRLLK